MCGSGFLALSSGWTKGHSVQSWDYALEHDFTLKVNILKSSEMNIALFISGIAISTRYYFFDPKINFNSPSNSLFISLVLEWPYSSISIPFLFARQIDRKGGEIRSTSRFPYLSTKTGSANADSNSLTTSTKSSDQGITYGELGVGSTGSKLMLQRKKKTKA